MNRMSGGNLMASYSKILVPVDLSETSRELLREAHDLGRKFNSELHLLHVVEPWPAVVAEPLPAAYAALLTDQQSQAARSVEHLIAGESCPIPCIQEIRVGPAAAEILQYAVQEHIDLIVMGTHGRAGVSRLLLGSVAQKVIQGAPCAVLIVPRPNHGNVRQESWPPA
jgi:universal stress protein A